MAPPILAQPLLKPAQGQATAQPRLGRPIQPQASFRMKKRRQTPRRAYTANTAPASRVAFPCGVREESPRKTALTFSRTAIKIVRERPQSPALRLTESSCLPTKVLVALVVLVVGPVGALVISPRLAKGPAVAGPAKDSRLLLSPCPS